MVFATAIITMVGGSITHFFSSNDVKSVYAAAPEMNYDNVKVAVQEFGIKYPVLQDNNYGAWNA
jgi:hypothetical protein